MPQTRTRSLVSFDSEEAGLNEAQPSTPKLRPRLTKPTTIDADSTRDFGESSPAREISREDIAREAYNRFISRGGEHGHDVEDWLAAEATLQP